MRKTALSLAFLALAFLAQPAKAAVLWYGGEDTSIVAIGTVTAVTSAGYDATYSRASVALQNSSSTADPPANRFTPSPATVSNQTTLWVHAVFDSTSVNTTTNNEQAVIIRSPDGVGRVYLRQNGTAGTLKLSIANAARSFTDLATLSQTFATGALVSLDMQIPYTCGGGDVTNIYLNAVLAATYTGSLCTDAAASLNAVEFAAVSSGSAGNCVGGAGSTCWSQIIIANEDTRAMKLATCALQAAGNTQLFTPSTLANVNKGAISDGTFVSTATGNQLSQWTCPTSAPAGLWGVKSVSIEARMQASSTGPQNMDWSTRIGGADFLAGTTTPVNVGGFTNLRHQYDTSPATSTTWGITEVYNTSTNQFNIGVKSLP